MILAAAALYISYGIAMTVMHTSFIYPFSQRDYPLPGFERVSVTGGGAAPIPLRLALGGPDQPAVLFFMGNAGSVGIFAPWLDLHRDAGRMIAAMEYPGGGGNPGTPSETRLKAQALAAYDWLAAQTDAPIVLHGYSMGSGLAIHVAANRPAAAVILDAPFARLCDLMADASNLPACRMPVQRWDSMADAPQVRAPVLILHGEGDRLIPLSQGRIIANALERAGNPVDFVPLAGGTHENLIDLPGYADRVNSFIGGL